MQCEYCLTDTLTTYRVDDGGTDVWLCVNCKHDVEYCERKGKEPLEP